VVTEEWCFGVRRSSVERLAGCVFSKLAITGKGVGRIVTNDSLVGRDRMSGEGRVARAVEPQCDVCNWKVGAKGASCCCWSDYDYLFRREERGEMRRGPLAVDFLLPTVVCAAVPDSQGQQRNDGNWCLSGSPLNREAHFE
jgi:hypothetical protein